MQKMTLQNEFGEYSVAAEVETLNDLVANVLIPLLLAAGYDRKTIDKVMPDDL